MAKDELSKGELRRKAAFEKLCEELAQQGYRMETLKVSIANANVFAIVVLAIAAVVFGGWYTLRNGNPIRQYLEDDNIMHLILLLAGLAAFTVFHELVHGITWSLFCRNHFKSIEFGIKMPSCTPYCTCSEPLKRNQYVAGAVMPLFIAGILPAVISIFTANVYLFLIGLVMISGASGDLMCIDRALKYKETGECIYFDHPYEVGLAVFER